MLVLDTKMHVLWFMLSAVSFSVMAQDVPRLPVDPALQNVKPYQASPEFPVKSGEYLAAPDGQDITEGYVPSVGAAQIPEDGSQEMAIDPATGEPVPATPPAEESASSDELYKETFTQKAVLALVDKVSAKTQRMEVAVPSKVTFHDIFVQIDKCHIAGDAVTPENAALVEIYGNTATQASASGERLFAGWLFKNRPSLTGLQSPYYDVSLLQCVADAPREKVVDDTKKEDEASGTAQENKENDSEERHPINAPEEQKTNAESVVGAQQGLTPEQAADKAVESVTKLLDEKSQDEGQPMPSSD